MIFKKSAMEVMLFCKMIQNFLQTCSHTPNILYTSGEDIFINDWDIQVDVKMREMHARTEGISYSPNPGLWPAGDKNATVVTSV